ncbi:MAG: endonuclease [Erysipelotrichales bacterium]|nr:endonuclease [Erysipelotrichales bacterium]
MKKRLLNTILVLSIAILTGCNSNEISALPPSLSTGPSVVEDSESVSTLPPSESVSSELPSQSEEVSTQPPSASTKPDSEQVSESVSTLPPSYNSSQLGSAFDGYYSNVNFNTTGTALLSELRSLNSSKRKFTPGYKNLGKYFPQTDGDPEKPGNIIAFYSGTSVSFNGSFSGNVNREHVWPNSHGGNQVEGDLHMTRPTIASENGSRGNSFYVEGMKHSSNGWDPAMESFGLEEYRGISARIIFYCVIASNSLKLVEAEKGSSGDNSMGKLSDLLKWNLEYDIDETEIRRNEATLKIQGNRNPFIDDRTLACRVWGNTNNATKEVCRNAI